MWSTRKFSVKRHITNQHNGNAFLVPYIEYLVGRHAGLYSPSSQPEYQYKGKTNSWDIFREEFWREVARKAGKRKSESMKLIPDNFDISSTLY
jgi:hypothetical protein